MLDDPWAALLARQPTPPAEAAAVAPAEPAAAPPAPRPRAAPGGPSLASALADALEVRVPQISDQRLGFYGRAPRRWAPAWPARWRLRWSYLQLPCKRPLMHACETGCACACMEPPGLAMRACLRTGLQV